MDDKYRHNQQRLLAYLRDCFQSNGTAGVKDALRKMKFDRPTMSHVVAVVPKGERIRDGHEHLLGVLLYYRTDLILFVSPGVSPLYTSLLPDEIGLLLKNGPNDFNCESLKNTSTIFKLACENKDHNGRVTLADDTIYHVPTIGWATLRHLLSEWTTHDT